MLHKTSQAESHWSRSLAQHWPEYAMEGAGLGLFMISACTFGTLLAYPHSPVVLLIQNETALRSLMGIAMGLTLVGLVYSRFGKRSGAHLNPVTTITFLRLAKMERADAFFYILAQFAGAAAGVYLASFALGPWLSHPSVNYVVTSPGRYGAAGAFLAEALITFLLMLVVLRVSNNPRLNRYTGLCAGVLIMIYIVVAAPVSGMSMNPARTLGSAIPARHWTAVWIYFAAPLLGMLSAAEFHTRWSGAPRVLCAKLHHDNHERCFFRCNYPTGY